MNVGSDGRRSERLGYLPGVDGLRAVSVSAVFLFHAGVLDGGFIGVDVFFVISGFLITALLFAFMQRSPTLPGVLASMVIIFLAVMNESLSLDLTHLSTTDLSRTVGIKS